MSLHSTTLPSQPPPLHARSPYDVASFDSLTNSLRQHPDLTGESDKILNSFQLAKFVDGVRRFQDGNLGMQHKYRPALRLPAPLLNDRSTSGPLYHAIASAFRVKQSSPWRNFNFDNPKLYDDNIALLKRMEADLITAGLLKRPRIYFDKSVERLGLEEVKRLTEIVRQFGGTVVTEEEVASGKVTHIVVYDPEEHDAPSVLEEEAVEQTDREKKFLRTLALFDVPLEGEGDTLVTKRMALVHWWYFPSSFDEWMDAEDVTGEVEKEKSTVGPGGALVVGCKFIRDVEKFNEWGCENDYAVMDFERKLEYLQSHPTAMTADSSNKKRKKGGTAEVAAGSEPSSKKARRGSTESVSAPIVSGNKEIQLQVNPTARIVSDRRTIKGNDLIGARRIQTGLKGARGEIIRRTVYDGALRVDADAYKIVQNALTEFGGGNTPLLSGRSEWRKFLPMNALIRPTVDSGLGKSIIITELTELSEAEGGTGAVNRIVPILSALESQPADGGEALRIRGGGEDQGADAMEVEPAAYTEDQIVEESNVETNHAGTEHPAVGSPDEISLQAATAATPGESGDSPPAEMSAVDTSAAQEQKETIIEAATNETALSDTLSEEAQIQTAATEAVMEDSASEHNENSEVASEVVAASIEHPNLPQSAPSDVMLVVEANEIDLTESAGSDAGQAPSETPSSVAAVIANPSVKPDIDSSNTLCDIKALEPARQLSSSLHNPTATSNEETTRVPAFRPSWYDKSKASYFEQRSLPEWFNQSAPHRTPTSYIAIREQILDLAKKNSNQYITATALRRSITCDSGTIMRLHSFLTDWGFINSAQIGESSPSEIKMRNMRATWDQIGKNSKRKFSDVERSIIWSPERILALEKHIIASITKRKTSGDGRSVTDVDWEQVAADVGGGVTIKECQFMFLYPDKCPTAIPTSTSAPSSQETFYSNILDSVRPEVLKKVINASLNDTEDLAEAKKASLVGAIASVAAEKGREEEKQIRATLLDIVDQRVQRLENKIAMLDDVEALLEAERVSLELERRDMYTTRCRQWFGDGSS